MPQAAAAGNTFSDKFDNRRDALFLTSAYQTRRPNDTRWGIAFIHHKKATRFFIAGRVFLVRRRPINKQLFLDVVEVGRHWRLRVACALPSARVGVVADEHGLYMPGVAGRELHGVPRTRRDSGPGIDCSVVEGGVPWPPGPMRWDYVGVLAVEIFGVAGEGRPAKLLDH